MSPITKSSLILASSSELRFLLRQFIRSRRHHQLKPGFRRELILHTFGDGLEVSFCLGLKLNVSGERLDPRVLERKALGTNGAYKLQVAMRRTDPRLDISQDGFAGFSFADRSVALMWVGLDVVKCFHVFGNRASCREGRAVVKGAKSPDSIPIKWQV
jgi:hypothetical protein